MADVDPRVTGALSQSQTRPRPGCRGATTSAVLTVHDDWNRVVPGLAGSFRVLSYDRRGHSKSERPTGRGSVREDVADLAALIEHLALVPAFVVGSSFGASITLRLAGEAIGAFTRKHP